MTRGMGIGGMETTFAREGHAFRAGIREGERRAYWLVAIGALCAMEQAEHEEAVAGYATQAGDAANMMVHGLWFTFITVMNALAASGDEDASRVLGERGW